MMQDLIQSLPYKSPFLFVDEILSINEDEVSGSYRMKPDEFFYEGHFPGNPVTPGVILTEVAAQIGLVCLGLFLIRKETGAFVPLFSSSNVDFYKPVFPGEKVIVHSKKQYFRFSKLKCDVEMQNEKGELILKGQLSGMITAQED